MCYIHHMTLKRRRAGATETFSVSVDPETKAALRALADSEFGGNLSALITDMAAEARRRNAAGDFMRRHTLEPLDRAAAGALTAEIDREVARARKGRKSKAA